MCVWQSCLVLCVWTACHWPGDILCRNRLLAVFWCTQSMFSTAEWCRSGFCFLWASNCTFVWPKIRSDRRRPYRSRFEFIFSFTYAMFLQCSNEKKKKRNANGQIHWTEPKAIISSRRKAQNSIDNSLSRHRALGQTTQYINLKWKRARLSVNYVFTGDIWAKCGWNEFSAIEWTTIAGYGWSICSQWYTHKQQTANNRNMLCKPNKQKKFQIVTAWL